VHEYLGFVARPQAKLYRTHCSYSIQGGPAKVKPTYIFAGSIWMRR